MKEEQNYKVDYKYLRPIKAEYLRKWYDIPFYKKNELKADHYKNAAILPVKKNDENTLPFVYGGVVDENKNCIESTAITPIETFDYEYKIEEAKREKVVFCGYLINQWGHFLVDAVSRLWYFLENDLSVDKYVFFVEYNKTNVVHGNFKEFFELLGILNKVEIINKPTKYKEVIVPELGYKRRGCCYYSDKQKEVFNIIADNIKVEKSWVTYSKVFFTRSQLKKAKKTEFGLDSIDNFFEKNGYKIVSPEKISLSEMIYYIRNADECVSVSGSLPHNMLFGRDGQKLTIIERNILNNEIQVDINQIKKLDVTYIDANIAMYPVDLGYGPFILSYKGLLEKYANDNGLESVDTKYCSEKYLKKCFKKYMKEYRRVYHYSWFMEDWMVKYTDYLYEAYNDSLKYFGDYLSGHKPFKISQYFTVKYIKAIIKRILKK